MHENELENCQLFQYLPRCPGNNVVIGLGVVTSVSED